MSQPRHGGLVIARRSVVLGTLGALHGLGSVAARPAAPADAFAESVGVNVHLGSPPYREAFGPVARAIARLGVRHLRDELRPGNDLARWRALYDAGGVRSHLLVSPATNSEGEMLAYLKALGAEKVSAIEGQNEGDSDWFAGQPAARPSWAEAVNGYQRAVYRAIRARYSVDALPVVSPSVLDHRPEDMALLRPSAGARDVVAVHAYAQGDEEPETERDFAGLGWYLRAFRDPFKPGAPVMFTEAGYQTGLSGISAAAQGKYLPRLLLHAFGLGIRRTFLYELMDEGADLADPEQNYGLLRVSGAAKPAFHAVRMLLEALGDRGPAGVAGEAAVELVEGPDDLRVMMFGKRDGSAVVALWRAARSWDPAARRDVDVVAVPTRLRISAGVAATLRLSAGQAWEPVVSEAGVLRIAVDDTVTLLRV